MPSQSSEVKTREISAAALYLDCGPLQLDDTPTDGDDSGRVPVSMLIRSNEGVERFGESWYHDFAGMRHKGRVPIDYRHDPDQVIGYLDKFEEKRDGMHASGYLVPYQDDVVGEITHKAKAGVPYEASIYFGGNGLRVEEVSPSGTAKVNGRTVHGPAVIFREWPLRGVAICPYGADSSTRTKLNQDDTFHVPIVSEEKNMSEESRPKRAKPYMDDSTPEEPLTKAGFLAALGRAFGIGGDDPAPPETEGDGLGDGPPTVDKQEPDKQEGQADATPAEDTQTADANPGQRFVDAFGDRGARWFVEGLSFEDAQTRYVAELEAEIEELKQQLSAVDRGEDEPAEFSDAEPDADAERRKQYAATIGPRLGSFAASIKLPKR